MKSRRHDLPHSLLAVASRAGMARAEQSPAQRFVLAASAGIFIAIAAAFYVSLSQQPNTLVSVLASGLCFTLSFRSYWAALNCFRLCSPRPPQPRVAILAHAKRSAAA